MGTRVDEEKAAQHQSFNDWPNDAGFETLHEEKTPIDLEVTGSIPAYAAGVLYRTGPGGHQVRTNGNGTFAMSHWFDGFTQTHRFEIVRPINGANVTTIRYNSRHNCNKMIETIRTTGAYHEISFGQKQDPCQSLFRKAISTFQAAMSGRQEKDLDEANVGVTLHDHIPGMPSQRQPGSASTDSIWLKSDNSWLQEIDSSTLEPVGVTDQRSIHPQLTGTLSAAHMRTDPVTGDYFNYNLEFGRQAVYRVFKVSASSGKTSIIATIKSVRAAYIHSFILTKKYVILCIFSAYYAKGGAKILWTKNLVDAMDYDPNEKNKWLVIDRHNGKGVVGVFESDPFFAFHSANAWDEDSTTEKGKTDVTLDMSTYENLDILKRFWYENMKSTSPTALDYTGVHAGRARCSLGRYRLVGVGESSVPPSSRPKVAELVFAAPKADSAELPTFNGRYACKPSRYIYGVCDRGNSTFFDGLVKFDTRTQTAKHRIQQAQSPGEPIFVADPEGEDEDDGVLLSVVLDGTSGKSHLLVMDAKTFEEVGRAEMKTAVGFGFHGHFVRK